MSSPRPCGLCLGKQESPEFSQFLNLGESLEFLKVREPKRKLRIFLSQEYEKI